MKENAIIKVIEVNGNKHYLKNNRYHREDGPAWEHTNGNKEWFLNGLRHRTDGPAIEWANGYKSWYLDGTRLTESEFNIRKKKGIRRIN